MLLSQADFGQVLIIVTGQLGPKSAEELSNLQSGTTALYRVTLGPGLGRLIFAEFPRLVGRLCSYLLPNRMVEHPNTKSTQPRSETTSVTLYVIQSVNFQLAGRQEGRVQDWRQEEDGNARRRGRGNLRVGGQGRQGRKGEETVMNKVAHFVDLFSSLLRNIVTFLRHIHSTLVGLQGKPSGRS